MTSSIATISSPTQLEPKARPRVSEPVPVTEIDPDEFD